MPPRVFISYAWEDEPSYKLRVKAFAARLREDGIDARLDLWHTGEDRSIPDFMHSEVRHAHKVIVLCSPEYRRKVHLMEDGEQISGVGLETAVFTSRIWGQLDTRSKAIPVLFHGQWEESAPDYLLGMVRVDLSDDATFEQNYLELLRRITGRTEAARPVGSLPADIDPDPVAPLRGSRAAAPTPPPAHTPTPNPSTLLVEKLTAPQRKLLFQALVDSFTPSELGRIVDLDLGDPLHSVPENLDRQGHAHAVIEWAESRGRLQDLVNALIQHRAATPSVKAFVASLAPAPPPPLPPKQPRVFISKLPTVSPILIGRETELALLDAAWANPAANAVQIVASGGTGKTALMDKWFRRHLGDAPIFGWSFYSQGTSEDQRSQTSSDQFFAELLRWLGLTVGPTASVYAKAEAVAERLRAERVLLLLDGLEPLQDASGDMKDAAMKALLAELDTSNAGLAICTTRVRITELPDDAPRAQSHVLDNLTAEAGAAYLEKLGVRDEPDELQKASTEYDNHALALTLLGTYLVTFKQGDIRRRADIPKLIDTKRLKREAGHAQRVMRAYERMLRGKPELAILKALGHFDRPAEPAALNLVLHKMDLAVYDGALARLRDLRLVLPHSEAGALDCHPLIREHFAKFATKDRHSRLYEYYSKQAPHRPDTEEAMRPLFYAVYHGCRAGRHMEALSGIYRDRVLRGGEFYLTDKLGAFGTNLSLLASFFTTRWTTPVSTLSPADQSWVISQAAFALRALGRLADAVDPMRAGADRAVQEQDWTNAAIRYGNFSSLLLIVGRVQEAIRAGQQSVEFADRSGNPSERWGKRTTLADALHQTGALPGAAALFAEAYEIKRDHLAESTVLYSFYRYCDLLLTEGIADAARTHATQTLHWAPLYGNVLDSALARLAIARAGDPAHLTRAIEGLRRAGRLDYLPLGLLARGTQHDLDEVFKIANRSGMKLHLTDAHLAQARLHLSNGRRDDARTHYIKAAALVTETGYHRRDPELAELHAALHQKGDAANA